MAKISIKNVSKMIKKLDLCMLTTINGRGTPESRPMSNNHQVDYDGTSYFFTWDKSLTVKDLKKNTNVSLNFIDNKIFKKLFIAINGKARLSVKREEMEAHWSPDLEVWFKDGLDTKGIVMIAVEAKHIKVWEGKKEYEVTVSKSKRK